MIKIPTETFALVEEIVLEEQLSVSAYFRRLMILDLISRGKITDAKLYKMAATQRSG